MHRDAEAGLVPSLMESQILLHLEVLEPALRKRRARHRALRTDAWSMSTYHWVARLVANRRSCWVPIT